jgi:urease accessory protein
MSAVILPFRPAAAPDPVQPSSERAGRAQVAFAAREGITRLATLYQSTPLRVLLPRPATGDLPVAAVVNTGGGVLAGDRYDISVEVRAGARALAMPQAAEKVYRSEGPVSRIETRLEIAADGWLEWLPQETILFQDARFRRTTTLAIEAGARAMAGEILVFGRIARGERTTRGLIRDAWRVYRDQRLVWADAVHLEGDFAAALARPSGFAGASAHATFVYAAPDAPGRLTAMRSAIADLAGGPVRAGATSVAGLAIARWLSTDALALRRAFGSFWAAFRHAAAGLPPRLPVLWHV